jgi:hypothetical protein
MTNNDRAKDALPSQPGFRADATAASHPCDTGSSNNASNKISSEISALLQPSRICEVEIETMVSRAAGIRRLGRFLKGPIPMWELAMAARLPGQALSLLLVVHHQTALTGKAMTTLPNSLLTQFAIGKDAKARSLRQLEDAGLIRVVRSRGRSARVGLAAGGLIASPPTR